MSTTPIAAQAPAGPPMSPSPVPQGPRWVKVLAIVALPCSVVPFLGLCISAVGLGAGLFHRRRSAIVTSGIAFVIALLVTIGVASSSTPTPTASSAVAAPAPAAALPAPLAPAPQPAPAAAMPAPAVAPAPAAPAVPAAPAGPATSFGDGTYVVGTDIAAGTYKTSGPADGGIGMCTWERLRDTSGDAAAIITGDLVQGPSTVTISSSDGAFETQGCNTWTKVH